MVVAPQHIEDLLSAIRQHDRVQLRAWLEIFTEPEEQYAAVRALAEALRSENSGICWMSIFAFYEESSLAASGLMLTRRLILETKAEKNLPSAFTAN